MLPVQGNPQILGRLHGLENKESELDAKGRQLVEQLPDAKGRPEKPSTLPGPRCLTRGNHALTNLLEKLTLLAGPLRESADELGRGRECMPEHPVAVCEHGVNQLEESLYGGEWAATFRLMAGAAGSAERPRKIKITGVESIKPRHDSRERTKPSQRLGSGVCEGVTRSVPAKGGELGGRRFIRGQYDDEVEVPAACRLRATASDTHVAENMEHIFTEIKHLRAPSELQWIFRHLNRSPPNEFSRFLSYLRLLLRDLPPALPVRDSTVSKYSSFVSFEVEEELLGRTDAEIGALNEQLKAVFGWKSRTTGDQILSIEERGAPVLAIVDILERFHLKYPKDNVLKKWGIDIAAGAHKIYNQYGMTACEESTTRYE
ncbi:hypothetical protein L210DRAFT_935198 [Boletus edulis BED1]|uniref:Uncharacterized protein n=1 Tax=Boletus edulis BED1 TaxID=1328754 RepID=A0AAD4G819_BOLED|nr:hypothetical protein L210DRAFT_935198 [Boletus edulis BED1]